MEKAIEMAEDWARKIWQNATEKWKNRQQDLNYRKYVVRPGIKKILDNLVFERQRILAIDLGCGNGPETLYIRKVLEKRGLSGDIICLDSNGSFMEAAKQMIGFKVEMNRINISFERKDIQSYNQDGCRGSANLVTAIFLLQDLADAEILFQVAKRALVKGGYGLFILVHPEFGQKMKAKGALKINTELKSDKWRWSAEYPIVEKNGRTFYVPYFQREIEDYRKMAEKYFEEISFEVLQPSKEIIVWAHKKKILPFCKLPENVYFPEITEIPSSLIIKIKK